MNVTIEIPDKQAARFQKEAEARGLTMGQWLVELADRNAPQLSAEKLSQITLMQVCDKVRGLADDVDFVRDPSPGRDVSL